MPQTLLSLLYFSYNQFISQMCASSETMRFAVKRKPLRVTRPQGQQHSSFWLSVPYRYGIPLLVLSASVHWAASQTMFLTEVSLASSSGEVVSQNINGVGWSPLGLLITFLIGALMTVALIILGHFKLPRGMPVLGSCSLAISTACHGHDGRKDEAEQPLMYGVVEVTSHKTGRVGFSAGPVQPLSDGWYYDGIPDPPEPQSSVLLNPFMKY